MTLKTLDHLKVRPANRDDVIAINGESYDHSFKGYTALVDGQPAAIAGVMFHNPLTAFLNIAEGIDPKKHKRSAVILTRKLVSIIESLDAPVYAVADIRHPTAYNLLQHAGFKKHNDEVFIWIRQH